MSTYSQASPSYRGIAARYPQEEEEQEEEEQDSQISVFFGDILSSPQKRRLGKLNGSPLSDENSIVGSRRDTLVPQVGKDEDDNNKAIGLDFDSTKYRESPTLQLLQPTSKLICIITYDRIDPALRPPPATERERPLALALPVGPRFDAPLLPLPNAAYESTNANTTESA